MEAPEVHMLVGLAALLTALAVGAEVRLHDPLSSPVIGAEDPYTHMALVREHLRDGSIDPLHEGGAIYPPGMHGFVAAALVLTGMDLGTLARFLPVLFGLIGILGTGFLLWRLGGPLAGGFGALAMALLPEAVLRTTMLAPAAMDLAVLPLLLLALVRTVQGDRGWAVLAAVVTLFLLLAHPWLLSILVAATAVLLLLAVAFPWPTAHRTPTPKGIAAVVAILGTAWGASLAGCWGACGPGFRDVLPGGGATLALLAPFAVLAALGLALFLSRAPLALERLLGRTAEPALSLAARIVPRVLVGLVAAGVTAHARVGGLPNLVDPPVMFGWPILALAALGILGIGAARGPALHMGTALVVVSYPFVMYDPLQSPFWSHRTAIYLGVGLVILASLAAAGIVRYAAERASDRLAVRRSRVSRTAAIGVPMLLAATILAGAVWAATPRAPSWYRLYEPCEMAGLEEAAGRANAEPEAIVVTAAWQSKLVIAAHTANASRVWFDAELFRSPEERQRVLRYHDQIGIPTYFVVDRHRADAAANANLTFLEGERWERVGTWCTASPAPAEPLSIHRTGAIA